MFLLSLIVWQLRKRSLCIWSLSHQTSAGTWESSQPIILNDENHSENNHRAQLAVVAVSQSSGFPLWRDGPVAQDWTQCSSILILVCLCPGRISCPHTPHWTRHEESLRAAHRVPLGLVVQHHEWTLKAACLPKIGFVEEDESVFGFLDLSLVLRGCHLIPVFFNGQILELLTTLHSAAHPPGEFDGSHFTSICMYPSLHSL